MTYNPNQQMVERHGSPFPRRNCLDLFCPAEKAIWDAAQAVELAGADVRLTEALNLLHEAQSKVADWYEEFGPREGGA